MARHFPELQWRERLSEFEGSGLSVAGFCDSIGVSVKTFYKWRRKFRDEAATSRSSFFLVVLEPSKLEIEFPCGAIVRVANDAREIRPLVEVLFELRVEPCLGLVMA